MKTKVMKRELMGVELESWLIILEINAVLFGAFWLIMRFWL